MRSAWKSKRGWTQKWLASQLERITWIICTKFKFPGCTHCMNGIDPNFLSKLPAIVKERSPFIFSGSRNSGIDHLLIQMLLSLSIKPIFLGTFSNIVNEVHKIKYSKSIVNYLDCAHTSIVNKEQTLRCEFMP